MHRMIRAAFWMICDADGRWMANQTQFSCINESNFDTSVGLFIANGMEFRRSDAGIAPGRLLFAICLRV